MSYCFDRLPAQGPVILWKADDLSPNTLHPASAPERPGWTGFSPLSLDLLAENPHTGEGFLGKNAVWTTT